MPAKTKPNARTARPQVNGVTAKPVPVPTKPKRPKYSASTEYFWVWLGWLGIGVTVVLFTSSLVVMSLTSKHQLSATGTPPLTPPSMLSRAPLTGLPVSADTLQRRPWAVVISNLTASRPQAGLSFADLVIEAPAEGGVTRYLALYQSQLPSGLVGPVRSARPYFNDWASAFSALYSHSGGSAEALSQLQNGYGNLLDVNEFSNGAAYERLPDKKAPHNLFTTADRFWNYLTAHSLSTNTTTPSLTFADTAPTSGTPAASLTLPYYPADYQVRYDYRASDHSYLRAVGGNTQFDSTTKNPIGVQNVAVLFTDITPVPHDPLLKVNLTTTGTGSLLLLRDGQLYRGHWSLPSATGQLTFTDNQGNPLPLKPGQTWISVMDSSLASAIAATPSTPFRLLP